MKPYYQDKWVIREATIDDMDNLVSFFDTNLKGDWFMLKNKWLKILTGIASDGSKHTPDICAIVEDREVHILVAVAVMSRYTKKLFNLIVRGDYRNQGIGKMLMEYLHPRYVRCKTDMTAGNPIKFYEKLNYVHVGNYDLWGNKALVGKNKNIAWMEIAAKRCCQEVMELV